MAAPTFIGVQTYPVDGGTLTANTQTITPLGTEQLGDLLVAVAWNRSSSGTHSMSTTGGQAWTSSTQYNGTTIRMGVFSCRFNGTFGASPVVTFGATTCNEVQYFVYRPPAGDYTWAVDTALANTAVSAPGSPFTFTRTGITPVNNNNVTMAFFHCIAANTWGTLSGTNWVQTSLGAQYRCTSGSGQSTAYAYQCQGTKAATNNVSLNESASTAGSTSIISFYASPPSAPTVTSSMVTTQADTTATGNGNVTVGPALTRGVCWKTSTGPTISDNVAYAGAGGTGAYTCSLTGLVAGTLYYGKAFATNSGGTSYGAEFQFYASNAGLYIDNAMRADVNPVDGDWAAVTGTAAIKIVSNNFVGV